MPQVANTSMGGASFPESNYRYTQRKVLTHTMAMRCGNGLEYVDKAVVPSAGNKHVSDSLQTISLSKCAASMTTNEASIPDAIKTIFSSFTPHVSVLYFCWNNQFQVEE